MNTSLYAEPTTSMQADPEVSQDPETASVSFRRAFPISVARCAEGDAAELDWVPAREQKVVPAEMAEECDTCPGRQQCLLWALFSDERGYWAGTTTTDRAQMTTLEQTSLDTAIWLQEQAKLGGNQEQIPHRPGEGSLRHYRHDRCRCHECRAANSAARAAERARAKECAGA